MTQKDELRSRVEARRKRLEARVEELKADASASARREKDEIERELSSLRSTLAKGWDNLTEEVAGKLNEWLRD